MLHAHRVELPKLTTERPGSQDMPHATQAAARTADRPAALMLGMGWFPASVGGLDRYYRSLLEQLPEAHGVAIGPAEDAPRRVEIVGRGELPLALRLAGFWRAAQRGARKAEVVDAHFALYALAPLLMGRSRSLPSVFHFHGPWAQESRAAGRRSRVGFIARHALERTALRRADAHVVLSGAFRRLLVERYRVSPWSVHVFPPGVQPGRVHTRRARRRPRQARPRALSFRGDLRATARAAHGDRGAARRVGAPGGSA